MAKSCLIERARYCRQAVSQDFLPAFKMILSPGIKIKMPVWEFIKYFASLGANKIPLLRKLISGKEQVDLSRYIKAYDNTTASFHPYQGLLNRITDLLNIKGGELVVEMGSGTGNLGRKVKEKGARVISLDSSPEANQIHRNKDPQANIIQFNIDAPGNAFPFANHSVDRVCGSNLWVYIQNRSHAYAEIKRILRPDGTLVLSVERKGYSPTPILREQLRIEYDRYQKEERITPLTAAVKVYKDFIERQKDLLITAEEVKKLMSGIASGKYRTFTENEIVAELEANGFEVVHQEIAYVGQNIIIVARPRS